MRISLLVGFILALSASLHAADEPAITIAFDRQAGRTGRFEVHGLTAEQLRQIEAATKSSGDWTGILIVSVGAAKGAPQPMLGDYSVADGKLQFEPRFPLRPGLTYRATSR